MAKIGAKMIVQACEQGSTNFRWGFREGEKVVVIDAAPDTPADMIAVESEARGMVGFFAPSDLLYVGVNGTVPADAVINDKIAYCYVAYMGFRKCAGYATPNALAIVQANYGADNVTVEYFEPGAPIPDKLTPM